MNKKKLEAELKTLQREMLQLNQVAKRIAHIRATQTKVETNGFKESIKIRDRKNVVQQRISELLQQLGKTVSQVKLPDTESKYNRYTDTDYRVAGQPKMESETQVETAKTLELTVENYKRVKEETGLNDRDIAEKHFRVSYTTMQVFKRENGLVGKPGRKKKVEAENVVHVNKEGSLKVEVGYVHPTVKENGQLRAELEQLKAEKETLLLQLAQFEGLQWKDRFVRLSALQAELDNFIAETQGLHIVDHTDEHLLALIVELAEVANEEKSFKYWKAQRDVNRDALLEELVDVLHFILSRGNMFNLWSSFVGATPVQLENVTKQILAMMQFAHQNDTISLATHFIGLTQMLDYTWVDIETAYNLKLSKNKARQANGY